MECISHQINSQDLHLMCNKGEAGSCQLGLIFWFGPRHGTVNNQISCIKEFHHSKSHLGRGKPGAVAMARPSGINTLPHQYNHLLNFSYWTTITTKIWRRKWLPTPLFLPGKSQRQRRLAGYRPWVCKELDTTEVTKQQQQQGQRYTVNHLLIMNQLFLMKKQ